MPAKLPAGLPLQPVQVAASEALIGRVLPVAITGVGPNSLFGRLSSEEPEKASRPSDRSLSLRGDAPPVPLAAERRHR